MLEKIILTLYIIHVIGSELQYVSRNGQKRPRGTVYFPSSKIHEAMLISSMYKIGNFEIRYEAKTITKLNNFFSGKVVPNK